MKSLKARISKEIHQFDIVSLLYILHEMGYRQEQIFFVSQYDLSSQPSLLRKIEFRDKPQPRVVVFVNIGLLSVQTPLPSYFFHKLDQGFMDVEAFGQFLAFFDQRLLREFILAIYPEINPDVFPDWELAKKRFVGMLNLRSSATLHWLFTTVFPELSVQVEKGILSRSVTTRDIVLGKSLLDGNSIFGNKVSTPVHGLIVVLTSNEERTCTGVPWPREISERMEQMIFPLLKSVGIDLEVFLIIRSQKSWAKLNTESYLGYDRIKGGRAQQRRIPIFSGYLVE